MKNLALEPLGRLDSTVLRLNRGGHSTFAYILSRATMEFLGVTVPDYPRSWYDGEVVVAVKSSDMAWLREIGRLTEFENLVLAHLQEEAREVAEEATARGDLVSADSYTDLIVVEDLQTYILDSPSEAKRSESGDTTNAVRKLIAVGENGEVEFKETLEAGGTNPQYKAAVFHSSLKTICAFLNSGGGTLLIGVHDDGRIIGLEPDGATDAKGRDVFLQKIGNALRGRLSRYIGSLVQVTFINIDAKTIAQVSVQASPEAVTLDGKLYVRDLAATHELSAAEAISWEQNRRQVSK